MPATRPSAPHAARPVALALPLALTLALAGGALPAGLAAQGAQGARESAPAAGDAGRPERRGWLVGGSVGVPRSGGGTEPALFTLGLHGTQVRPGRPGADLALGTMPRVLAAGVLAVGARAGVALPFALAPGVLLLPSGGVSLLGGVGAGGGAATTGLNAGVAAVVLPAGALGLRAGATWHRFGEASRGVWLLEVGLVRGSPRR